MTPTNLSAAQNGNFKGNPGHGPIPLLESDIVLLHNQIGIGRLCQAGCDMPRNAEA